jgi:hypothetical protein
MAEFEACGKTAESFWNKHTSQDGEKLGYQQLCDKLLAARKNTVKGSDETLATAARHYFNGDLETAPNRLFMYQKTGKWCLYKSVAKIAEIWKGLFTADPEVAKRWEAMDIQDNDFDQVSTPSGPSPSHLA